MILSQDDLTALEIDKIRQAVIERDGYRCVLCFSTPVEIHEMVPRSRHRRNSSKVFNAENMICLCTGCHLKWHTDMAFKKEAIERLKSLLESPLSTPDE